LIFVRSFLALPESTNYPFGSSFWKQQVKDSFCLILVIQVYSKMMVANIWIYPRSIYGGRATDLN